MTITTDLKLRDYYAAHAPPLPETMMIAQLPPEQQLAYLTQWAYRYADMMVAQRDLPPGALITVPPK